MNHEGGSVVRGLWSLKQTLFKEMSLGLGRNVTCIMSQWFIWRFLIAIFDAD